MQGLCLKVKGQRRAISALWVITNCTLRPMQGLCRLTPFVAQPCALLNLLFQGQPLRVVSLESDPSWQWSRRGEGDVVHKERCLVCVCGGGFA